MRREERGEPEPEPSTSLRLVFACRVWHTALRADAALPGLYCARSPQSRLVARQHAGAVVIDGTPPGWSACMHEPAAEVLLGGRVSWAVHVRHGGSGIAADLRAARLESFDVDGGSSRVDLTLPHPSGTAPVRFLGGVTNLAVHRPAGVAARLRVYGGASDVTFDAEHVSAVPGELRLESRGAAAAGRGYDVEVQGGACGVTVDTYHPSGAPPSGMSPAR